MVDLWPGVVQGAVGVVAVGGAAGVCWRVVRGVRDAVLGGVEELRAELETHSEQDNRRFAEQAEGLAGLAEVLGEVRGSLSVVQQDVGWLRWGAGGRGKGE